MSNHESNYQVIEFPKQEERPQPVAGKGMSLRHRVPGTITNQVRQMILAELRAGRSAVQVGRAYQVAVNVVLELMIRDTERRLLAMMRPQRAA